MRSAWRLAELQWIKAWPLVSWAAFTGRERIDLDPRRPHRHRPVRAPTVAAWSSTPIDQLNTEHLDGFEALRRRHQPSTTTPKPWHGRLFGVRQLLYERGQIEEPPKRGRKGATIEDRLAIVAAAEIRGAMARYV